MNGVLASLNLPAALDDVTSTETLPESIKMKSAKLKQNGGGAEIMRLFSELPTLYQRNEDILTETSRILNEEKESDDNMRKQLGTKWSRMSSDQLTGPLVTEIGKYRGILHTASNADKMVKEKFESHRQGIELLSKNESELRASIPGQTAHATGETDTVRHLRQLMSEWNEVTTDRELLEKELKNTNCDIANDFLKALAENQLINEEHISKEKIGQIFGGLKQRVQASLDKQEILMNDIQASNNKFTGEKTGSSTGAERERILKMLAQASDAYAELKANLEEGTKFYNDLTPILVRLQQKVSDFAFARQTEKEDLMRQLQLSIVSGQAAKAVVDGVNNLVSSYLTAGTNAAPSPTNAPPRPPPPRPAAPGQSVESPIPPPRTQQSMQATPGAPPQQQQGYNPYQQQPQMQQFQQHPGYYQQQVPYGQPQPQMMFQPQYQPTFAAPYPTFPGAFPSYQQQQWPQQQQQGGFPPNPQFGQQNQQGGGGTNPFQ